MKNIFLQMLFAISVFTIVSLGCQKKSQNITLSNTDTSYAQILGVSKAIHRKESVDKTLGWIKKKFSLDTVAKEKDLEIRIFLEQNFGGVWYINYALTNNQWQGFHVRNQNKINWFTPPKGWKDFTMNLRGHDIFNLITYKEIEEGKYGKYDNGLAYNVIDGTHIYIEIITGKQYELRYYDNVDIDIVNYPDFVELQKLSELFQLIIPGFSLLVEKKQKFK